MSGAYWGLCALEILNAGEEMNKEELVSWVLKCQNEDGGFGGNIDHDSNLVFVRFAVMSRSYTLSALQILAICDKMETIDADRVAVFIKGLYQPDGSFITDKYGELDMRFIYCAVQSMALLKRLDELGGEVAVRRAGIVQYEGGDSRRSELQGNGRGFPLGGKGIPAAGEHQHRRTLPVFTVFLIVLENKPGKSRQFLGDGQPRFFVVQS